MPGTKMLKDFWWKRQDVSAAASAVDLNFQGLLPHAALLGGGIDTDNVVSDLTRKDIIVGKLLGEGGFCVVHGVTHMGNGNKDGKYAIKHIKGKLVKNQEKFQEAATDLLAEATYLSKFDHPNIIKLRGVSKGAANAYIGGHYDSFFLITDRLTCTLDQRIKEWSKDQRVNDTALLATKTRYALQLAKALRYLHERRIVYRDLKPQNVGLLGDQVQLFDFGLCIELPKESASNPILRFPLETAGTPRYSSPEMLMDEKYNTKTDIFSFAMVFYEMLVQKAPYEGFAIGDHLLQVAIHRRRPKIQKHNLPTDLVLVLRKCWTHDVILRINSDRLVKVLQYVEKHQFSTVPVRRADASASSKPKIAKKIRSSAAA